MLSPLKCTELRWTNHNLFGWSMFPSVKTTQLLVSMGSTRMRGQIKECLVRTSHCSASSHFISNFVLTLPIDVSRHTEERLPMILLLSPFTNKQVTEAWRSSNFTMFRNTNGRWRVYPGWWMSNCDYYIALLASFWLLAPVGWIDVY